MIILTAIILFPVAIVFLFVLSLLAPKSGNVDQQSLFWVKKIAFYDMFAAAIIFTLYSKYFEMAGVDGDTIKLALKLHHIAYLIGGIIFSIISDHVPKQTLLVFMSVASMISCVVAGFTSSTLVLVVSCVAGGFFKQSMSIAYSAIGELAASNPVQRYQQFGLLYAVSLLSSAFAPFVARYLLDINPYLPICVAAAIFGWNVNLSRAHIRPGTNVAVGKVDDLRKFSQIMSPVVIGALVLRALILFAETSMDPKNIPSYYENRFGAGYITVGIWSTLASVIGLIVHLFFSNTAIKYFGGESVLIARCLQLVVLLQGVESVWPRFPLSFTIFSFTAMIPTIVGSTLLGAASTSLVTHLVPPKHLGKAFGILNLLMAAVSAIGPYYGEKLFALIGNSWNWRLKGFIAAGHFFAVLLTTPILTFRIDWDNSALKKE